MKKPDLPPASPGALLALIIALAVLTALVITLPMARSLPILLVLALIVVELALVAFLIFAKTRNTTANRLAQIIDLRARERVVFARVLAIMGGCFFIGGQMWLAFSLSDFRWSDPYFWAAVISSAALVLVPTAFLLRDRKR